MKRISEAQWLLAGLVAAVPFVGAGCGAERNGDRESVDHVTQATAASGFVATTLALGRFDDIDVENRVLLTDGGGKPHHHRHHKDVWSSEQKTKGASDLYVQSNVWQPGGTTGWHTHPGHSLITVTEGTITAYEGDDPSCTPHVYTAGMGFVDRGGEHAHVLRNEGTVEARTIAVQLVPAAAARRIDEPANPACPF